MMEAGQKERTEDAALLPLKIEERGCQPRNTGTFHKLEKERKEPQEEAAMLSH